MAGLFFKPQRLVACKALERANLIPTLNAIENITLPIDLANAKADQAWVDRVVETVGLGDRLVGVFGPTKLSDGKHDPQAGDLPVDKVEILGKQRPYKQIAFELGISEVTVKLHRSAVMKKMQATSIGELIRAWDLLPRKLRERDT